MGYITLIGVKMILPFYYQVEGMEKLFVGIIKHVKKYHKSNPRALNKLFGVQNYQEYFQLRQKKTKLIFIK